MSTLSNRQLQEKIDSFGYWHYGFDLGNNVVIKPTYEADHEKRSNLKNFVWPMVLELFGGSLKGLRVLDIACNAGFWSLEAHKSGADYVLGLDARPTHVEQAELVRDALRIDPEQLEYKHMDIYDISRETVGGQYDLVLLLRVLNHLSNPLLALQKIRKVSKSFLVADIKLVDYQKPVLELRQENQADPRTGVDLGVALRPSRPAVDLMLNCSGFTDLKELIPRPPLPKSHFDRLRVVLSAHVSDSPGR
jgi:SAM-dependent methyltransferase